MLLVDIGCSSKRAPPSVSYYNEISSGGHIGNMEGLLTTNINILSSTAPVLITQAE